MKWSLRLGRILGIDVYMHLTFLLLLAWVGVSHYLQRRDWTDVVSGLLFIATLFAIVVLHELGHALTARRFGIQTRDITLLPIGGVARLERMPEDPKQELLVALAGPAVNVVLAIVIGSVMLILSSTSVFGGFSLVGGNFLGKLLWINVALAVFNMIPAFPMDGGRVLRAILAMRMDYVRATQIAASIGQLLALTFGFIGLFSQPLLVFIALFVWMGATSEASMVQIRSSLAGIPVARAMITEFHVVEASDPLQRVVDHVLAGFQCDFPVVEGGVLVGVLTRDDLLRAIGSGGPEGMVRDVMRREFETADPSEMLEPAFLRLQNCDLRTFPVVRDGHVLGLLTSENVGELMMIQAAVRGSLGGSGGPAAGAPR